MNAEELIESLSIKLWEYPFSAVLEDGSLRENGDPFSALVLFICFHTEHQMNGILNFIGNSTGRYLDETIGSFGLIGSEKNKIILEKIRFIASEAGMTHQAIQNDMVSRREFEVTTWGEVHGDKWDDAEEAIDALGDEIDFDHLWESITTFTDQHLDQIQSKYKKLDNKSR